MSDAAAATLPVLRFTTAPHVGRQAFEVWQERVADYLDASATRRLATVEAFRLQTTTWHLGDMLAAHSVFSEREQARLQRKVRTDPVDHYRLILQFEGTLRADADGRRATVGPGSLLLTDMARPEVFSFEAGSNVALFLPRDLVDEALPRPMDLHGLVPQGATAAMLCGHLRMLLAHLDQVRPDEAHALSQATAQLLAAAVAGGASPAFQAPSPAVEASLLRQACRYVDLHLTDAALSPQAIAAAFRISRATLYRLFEPYGGVAAFVRERRLLHVHALLAAPGQRHPLTTLAAAHGFNDASHLSRAFKQQFGYSPSETHGQAAARLQRVGPAAGSSGRTDTTTIALSDWLRGLRG